MNIIACPHFYTLEPNINLQLIQKAQASKCQWCPPHDDEEESLWLCLHKDCLAVLCGENAGKHSFYHNHHQPTHMLILNLNNYRAWCYICEIEVTQILEQRLKLAIYDNQMEQAVLTSEEEDILPEMDGEDETMAECDREDEESMDEDFDLYEDEYPRGTVGLKNLGFTCYMNAALQVLSNTPGFASYFMQCEGALALVRKSPALAPACRDLLKTIWTKSSITFVTPLLVYQVFKQMHPMFRSYTQQDSQEFLRYFLDSLHDELKHPLPLQPSEENDTDSEAESDNEDTRRCCSSPYKRRSSEPFNKDADGGDSEEAKYETCDSGVSDDESEVSSSSYLQRKRRRKHYSHTDIRQSDTVSAASVRDDSSCSASVDSSTHPPSPLRHSSPHSLTNSRVSSRTSGYASAKPSIDSNSFAGSSSSLNSAKTHKKRQSKGQTSKRAKKMPQQQYSGSVVSDLFDGHLISSVQCLTCNNISSRQETFQDLSLPIPSTDQQNTADGHTSTAASQSNSDGWMRWMWHWLISWVWGPAVSLHHCLSAFFSADELKGDNMYSCEKCGKLRNGLKFSKLVKLPEVLVVHLKRFRHDYMFSSKISQHVAFPMTGLSLHPFLHRDCVSEVREYSLYGVIIHSGSVGGGHYIAMAKNPNTGNWYEFDDEHVTRISEEDVQRSQAYVLFYKKSNPEADTIRARTSNIIQVAEHQRSLVRFYISKQWFNKFLKFAECGPIDNSDFLCPHGGVQPRKAKIVGSLVKEVRETVWEYLQNRFGGGPPCTKLYTCITCTSELHALRQRQHTEVTTFKLFNNKTIRLYAVSRSWFMLWESFVLDRSQIPPPAIDNSSVLRQHQLREANSSAYGRQMMNRYMGSSQHPDYVTITGDCWKFFLNIYGGGPEFCLQPGYEETLNQMRQIGPTSPNHEEEELHNEQVEDEEMEHQEDLKKSQESVFQSNVSDHENEFDYNTTDKLKNTEEFKHEESEEQKLHEEVNMCLPEKSDIDMSNCDAVLSDERDSIICNQNDKSYEVEPSSLVDVSIKTDSANGSCAVDVEHQDGEQSDIEMETVEPDLRTSIEKDERRPCDEPKASVEQEPHDSVSVVQKVPEQPNTSSAAAPSASNTSGNKRHGRRKQKSNKKRQKYSSGSSGDQPSIHKS